MKSKPVLANQEEYPDDSVLERVLKDNFEKYIILRETLTVEPLNLIYVWRFYNDGKSWLCKIMFKKKTILWLSVWDGYFRVVFYLSKKICNGIFDLAISNMVKKHYKQAELSGHSKPLLLEVNSKEIIADITQIAIYKKKF